jgi:transposase
MTKPASKPKVLCVDEITTYKGDGHFRLVVSAPELGLVLDLLADPSREGLANWLRAHGAAWCAHVETCCAEMWDCLSHGGVTLRPQAQRVVDRFHVMKILSDAVTKARRTVRRQAAEVE